jgi:LysR family transcriptional regulator, low CO2-responsive transcriptional regulator
LKDHLTVDEEARMTWARLRAFVAVADTGSVRAAAARLSVTESAVSAAVAALQAELGAALVERQGRGVVLIEGGRVYADYARRILGLLDEGAAAATQGADPESGELRLGAVTTAGEYLLPGLLASFLAAYPRVGVTLEIGVRDRVLELLGTHQLDLVIGGRPPKGQGLVTRAVRRNSLVVVAAPGVRPDVATTPWLLREAGSGTRATTLGLLDALQVDPPRLALGSHGAVVASATLGLGLALVSQDAVGRQLAAGELVVVPVTGTPLSRPWHAVTGSAPTATTRLFCAHLLDEDAAGNHVFRRASQPRRAEPRSG